MVSDNGRCWFVYLAKDGWPYGKVVCLRLLGGCCPSFKLGRLVGRVGVGRIENLAAKMKIEIRYALG